MLYSKRLKLRWVEDKDSDLILKLRNDKMFKKYFYSDEPISLDMHRRFIAKVVANGDKYFAIDKIDDNTTIGFIGLCHIDYVHRKSEYGWLILDPEFRGNKYGDEAELLVYTYAFDTLNMNKVYCEVLADNDIVVKQHKRNGYKVTGTFKDHIYKYGKYVDVVWMEVIKDEFEEIKSSERYNGFIGG